MVRLGGRDADQVEVLSGLRPGDVYAAKNSFVVKAELGKRSAAHEH
jgi:cobalt-zinc-cadmium efflux system membrane fusion protein